MSEYPLCLVNKIIKKVTMCQLFNWNVYYLQLIRKLMKHRKNWSECEFDEYSLLGFSLRIYHLNQCLNQVAIIFS